MRSFFRNLRKQFANDGKPFKYLRYAIGEIILVVIGILIALQINDWNEDRKARKSEKELLISLSEDFKSNMASLQTSFEAIAGVVEGYSRVLEHAGKLNDGISQGMKQDVFRTGFVKTNLVDGALTAVLGSSSLELIRNDSLKRMLTSYPAHLQSFKEEETDLVNYVLDFQRPLIRKYLNLSDALLQDPRFDELKKNIPESDFKGLLTNREYLNVVIGVRYINTDLLYNGRELYEYTRKISEVVDKELQKFSP